MGFTAHLILPHIAQEVKKDTLLKKDKIYKSNSLFFNFNR
jgi:hypothetical protein